MPLLSIETNTQASDIDSVAASFSKAVAKILGKPEQYVMVKISHVPSLIFGGSDAPTAFLQLHSLGLTEEKTADYSAALCELVLLHFKIPKERIYIHFCSPQRHMWGWNGGTF